MPLQSDSPIPDDPAARIEGFARAAGLAPARWIGIGIADKTTRAAFAGMQALIDLEPNPTKVGRLEL